MLDPFTENLVFVRIVFDTITRRHTAEGIEDAHHAQTTNVKDATT